MTEHIKKPCCKCGKPSRNAEVVWEQKIYPDVKGLVYICKKCVSQRKKEHPDELRESYEKWLQEDGNNASI